MRRRSKKQRRRERRAARRHGMTVHEYRKSRDRDDSRGDT